MILSKIKRLYKDSGLILFLFRLPNRFIKFILNKLTTTYYSFICGSFGKSVNIEYGVHIEVAKNVHIGDNVFIAKGTKIVSENNSSNFIIKDNVHIGNNCHIDHTGELIINRNTLLSENVTIYCHSHGFDPRSVPIPIAKTIGNNCWLGSKSMILESVNFIAPLTIIGAGSILTKSIMLEKGVYAGIPAKKIRNNVN